MQSTLLYTLRQLQYLVACIESGSLAGAAERLNVSQPSISAAIAKMETALGVQLLLRHHAQGVTPTAVAERLLPAAKRLLGHADDLQRQALASGETVSGELRLGSFVTLAPAYLPGLIAALHRHYPALHLRLGEGSEDRLVAGLRQGQYEMALLYDFGLPEDIESIALTKVAPHVLLPGSHPLAAQNTIAFADLAEEPMILLDAVPSRAYFTGLLHAAGITPKIAFSSPSLELVRGLVGQGLGYALLATRPHGDVSYDGQPLAVRPIREQATPSPIVLARLRSLRPTQVMMAFERIAQAYFKAVK